MFKLPFRDLEKDFIDNKKYCNDLLKEQKLDYEFYGTQLTISYADRISLFLASNSNIAEKIQSYVLQDFPEEEIIRKILISLVNKEFGDFETEKLLKLSIAIIISITSKSKIDYPFEILDIKFKANKTIKLILKPLITFMSYKSIILIFSSFSYLLEELHFNEVFQYQSEEIESLLKHLNNIEKSPIWNKEEIIYQFLIRLNFYLESHDENGEPSTVLFMHVLKAIFYEIDYFHRICEYFAINRWNILFTLKKEYDLNSISQEENFLNSIKPYYPIISSLEGTGFRLVKGEARNIGFGAIGLNSVVAKVLGFISIGDQIKLAKPFGEYQIQFNDDINGPYVQLKNNSCVRINSQVDLDKYKSEISTILALGDLLINELDIPGSIPSKRIAKDHRSWVISSLTKFINVDHSQIAHLENIFNENLQIRNHDNIIPELKDFFFKNRKLITAFRSVELFKHFNVLIHPDWTPKWYEVSNKDWRLFRNWIKKTRYKELSTENSKFHQIIGETDDISVRVLSQGEIPFKIENNKIIIEEYGSILYYIFLDKSSDLGELEPNESLFNPISLFHQSIKPTFALDEEMRLNAAINNFNAPYLDSIKENIHGLYVEPNSNQEKDFISSKIKELHSDISLGSINFLKNNLPIFNDNKKDEILTKTILRAKFDLTIFKDGLIHFSAVNAPLNSFKSKEINISIPQLNQLGYYYDINGENLISDEQEILLQDGDIIIPESFTSSIIKVMSFINDELKFIFNKSNHYNLDSENKKSIIGVKVIGINKNYSVGIYGRIIGYSSSPVCFASPTWHLSKGSYCNGEMTDSFVLDMDCFLNLDLSLLLSKTGMFRGIPVFTQIEPDLDIIASNLDRILFENLKVKHINSLLSDIDEESLTKKIIKIFLEYNTKKGLKTFAKIKNISQKIPENMYLNITDPIQRLEIFLNLESTLRTVNFHDIFNKTVTNYLLQTIIPEITNFYKNPYSCSNCGTKLDLIIENTCPTCSNSVEIEKDLNVIIDKFKRLEALITNKKNIKLDTNVNALCDYVNIQLNPFYSR